MSGPGAAQWAALRDPGGVSRARLPRRERSGLRALTLTLLLAGGMGAEAQPDQHYEFREPSKNGIGKLYMGREIAKTTGPATAAWQDRPSRELEQRPDRLVAHLGVEPDDVIADIGAGTGYHAFRIAPLVAEGKVIAVEIDPEWIAMIEQRARLEGVTNVETILGTPTDPRLAAECVDLALMVDVYHEFSHPIEMMGAIKKAVKTNGRIVLVEYRAEDPKVDVIRTHKMTQRQVKLEMRAAGLDWIETKDVLPQQHMMFFGKGDASGRR